MRFPEHRTQYCNFTFPHVGNTFHELQKYDLFVNITPESSGKELGNCGRKSYSLSENKIVFFFVKMRVQQIEYYGNARIIPCAL